jgi:hypothetical protein
MATEFQTFRRLVIGIQPSAAQMSMPLAVELANLLDLELLGLFLEDTSLRDLAGIPFARELRSLGGGWHPVEVERMARELELSARSCERVFTEAIKRLPIKCQFEIVRGPTAATISSISRTGDIVMIIEPASPAERATQQFLWLIEAAFRSAAAVMLVPPVIARTRGPIVAIAAAPDDPCIQHAAAIAIAAKEELDIIEIYRGGADDIALHRLAADHALAIKRVGVADMAPSDPARLLATLHQLRERLVVMTRGTFPNEFAASLSSSERVPVLISEPSTAPTSSRT